MIAIDEVIKGHKRYKLTTQGILVINDIKDSFERCLYEWFNKYNIELYLQVTLSNCEIQYKRVRQEFSTPFFQFAHISTASTRNM